ncbi:MAG: hypothetical protein E7487_02055 [Ruminococcaceae bacterium]|nr:hypothetical protein [Oscillospiraceae bacterium]
MVKGVNKKIIEVRSLESDRFERAIFFLRDTCAEDTAKSIRRSAKLCLKEEFGISAGSRLWKRLQLFFYCLLSALSGMIFTLLLK